MTDSSVEAFLAGVADERRRVDAQAACAIMADVTGTAPAMWSGGIVGFGSYHYRYESGREGDAPIVGLSPRKQALTLYLYLGGFDDEGLLQRLGPHTTGKGCLYLKRLSDVDEQVLRALIGKAFTRRPAG